MVKSAVIKKLEMPVWKYWREAKNDLKTARNKEDCQADQSQGRLGNGGRCKLYKALKRKVELETQVEHLRQDADEWEQVVE